MSQWLCGEDPPAPLQLTLWDRLSGQATAKVIAHAGQVEAWKMRENLATLDYLRSGPRRRRRWWQRDP